ncbi:MAG: hypothetical protein ABR568_22405, partial [Pyrinomonadaceae bacterium]
IKRFAGALKSLSAKEIVKVNGDNRFVLESPDSDGSIHQVWQESFKGIPLWSEWMIWQKINYIHANPVKGRLVSSAKDYRWSSFRAFYADSGEPLAVDHEWWWDDDLEKLSKAVKESGWRSYHKRIEKLRRVMLILLRGFFNWSGGKPPFPTCKFVILNCPVQLPQICRLGRAVYPRSRCHGLLLEQKALHWRLTWLLVLSKVCH